MIIISPVCPTLHGTAYADPIGAGSGFEPGFATFALTERNDY
jgi:hypothetical protein